MNKPVAWVELEAWLSGECYPDDCFGDEEFTGSIPLYTHPVKELTDDDIAKVVHELNQKANTPERWVTAMEIGAETIIQLRDELAILRKAQENV